MKAIIIIVVSVLVVCILIFYLQRYGTKTGVTGKREFIVSFMKNDSLKFSQFSKTGDFMSFMNTENKDSLDFYLMQFSKFKVDSLAKP